MDRLTDELDSGAISSDAKSILNDYFFVLLSHFWFQYEEFAVVEAVVRRRVAQVSQNNFQSPI